MLLKDLFDRDITRRINPAVVVSELDEYHVNQEMDEYVFTPVITKNIYKFLDAIAHKKEGKSGVWISGYYGSGKSHFIKYLFYCLNENTSEKALQRLQASIKDLPPLEEPTPGTMTALLNSLSQLSVDEIIFNIDVVSDQKNEKDRITRVLLNELNKFRGYNNQNIALALYLEKPLDKAGKFQDFKDKIRSAFNEDWDGNQSSFIIMYLDKVLDLVKEFMPDLDKDSLKNSIKEKAASYSVEFLVSELAEFVKDKPQSYRLVFLIDEVSQYIGKNTSLLLNLQSILEEIGSRIGHKVWIVCTAQQDLSKLIASTDDRTEDFGKILGRFETIISLESQDAAFITKKRVLDKNSAGIGALNDYYKDNKGAIENQFVFDHDLYKNYTDREDFILTYPFIPYHFRLISDVFQSFSNSGFVGEGVRNTERAILGITHFTANLVKEEGLGYFVPFDLFFNQQLERNLSHTARNILDRAYKLDAVKEDPFALRIVKTLFMISNLGDSQSINFPANIENIALLMMDSVHSTKIDVQSKVTSTLSKLESSNIIQEIEGKYRFLKEDEIEVANLIRSTSVTAEDRISYFYDNIIKKTLQPSGQINFGSRSFRIAIKADDKEYGSRGDFLLKFSVYNTTPIQELAINTPTSDLVIGISEWLRKDPDINSKILDFIRTQKYIGDHSASATGTRLRTINVFRENNTTLLREILLKFEQNFLTLPVISGQKILEATDLTGQSPQSRLDSMLQIHLQMLYRKHELAIGLATTNADFLSYAKSQQKELHSDITPAEQEVISKIELRGEGALVNDIISDFDRSPFGWKDIATLHALLKLAKKGLYRFVWRNDEIDLVSFAEKSINSREREAIEIYKAKIHSKEEIETFKHNVNNVVFASTIIPPALTEFDAVVEHFKDQMKPVLTRLNEFIKTYAQWPFKKEMANFHSLLSEIYTHRSQDSLVDAFNAKKELLRSYRDVESQAIDFVQYNFEEYKSIYEYIKINKDNFSTLSGDLPARALEMENYFVQDPAPWDKFPQIRKAHKELKTAIDQKVKELREKVIQKYETIFDEIEKAKKEKNITEQALTTDREYMLKSIKSESNILRLQLADLKSTGLRKTNLLSIENHLAQQDSEKTGNNYVETLDVSVAAEMAPTTIQTPEELDAYIAKLRERLMVKLAKHKKLFLN